LPDEFGPAHKGGLTISRRLAYLRPEQVLRGIAMAASEAAAGNLTIRQLQIFLVASRSESFSSAAQKLGIAQPTLSASILRIERQLGVSVFDRSSRHMRLTRAGGRLAVAAADLVHIYQSTIRNLREEKDAKSRIRFAMVPAINGAIAPAAIAQFKKMHPDQEISLHDVDAEDAISMVLDATVDFAILSNLPPMSGLQHEVIGQTRIDVLISAESELARRTSVGWDDLSELPLILAGSLKRRGHLQAIWEDASYELRATYEVNDIATGVALAAEGLGYILLTNTYLPRPLNPALAAIPLTSGSMPRPLHVAYLEQRQISAAARALIDCLQEQLNLAK